MSDHEYSQGICQDGAAILKDGVPMTPEEIIAELERGQAAQSERAEPTAPIEWSNHRQSNDEIPYDHVTAETPFGRFEITWKGWKEHDRPTVDETPWGDYFGAFETVEEAKAACEAEYFRRHMKTHPPARLADFLKRLNKLDAWTTQLIEERDFWEGKASELADAVGEHFGIDFGEHTSANCPVQFAIDTLEEMPAQPADGVPEDTVNRLQHLLEGIENVRRNAGVDGYLWGYTNAMHKELEEIIQALPQPPTQKEGATDNG